MNLVHTSKRARPRPSRQQFVLSFLVIIAVAAVATGYLAANPTGRISGRVTDQRSGEPIMSATVLVEGTTLGAQTDLDGFYTVLNVLPGLYSLTVKYVGYDTKNIPGVQVAADSLSTVDIQLVESKVEGDSTQVMAKGHIVQFNTAGTQRSVSAERAPTLPVTTLDEILNLQVPFAAQGSPSCLDVDLPRAYINPYDPQSCLRYGGPFNTEEYSSLPENRFLDVVGNPLSTFSIDVDVASYANARRFIRQQTLPPKDAVRIEELVNYFDYDYPLPGEEHPFSITVEQADCPWQREHRLVHIGLQGRKFSGSELPPSNLVFLIDVSGSMQPENKLPLVQQAFRLLVDQLNPSDRVAIVVYAGAAGLVLPSTRGSDKQTIRHAIERLKAGGSTAGAAGIQLAYQVAQEHFVRGGNNRIILATDGDFNVGINNTDELVRLIEEKRKAGVFLTILGFGMDNLKDSRLEQLADKGNGHYAYIDNLREARKVFVTDLTGTLFTIAKDVKLQIEFNPARIASYRLIGYENRVLAKEDFADDRVDSGELGAGHTVTALYEVVPAGTRSTEVLRYQSPPVAPEARYSDEVLTVKLRYKQPDGETSRLLVVPVQDRPVELSRSSDNFRFSAAVAEFGLLLRDSEHKGNASWAQVQELAMGSLGTDRDGFRVEFVDLVNNAARLSSPQVSR